MGNLCIFERCHKSCGSCHISEPEIVETLLFLREGWQRGEGQKEAWIWFKEFKGYVEETFTSNSWPANTDVFSCCSVTVEVFCLLNCILETPRIRIKLFRGMSWVYHLAGKDEDIAKPWHSNVESFHQSFIDMSTYLSKPERMYCIACPTPPTCFEERQEERQEGARPWKKQKGFYHYASLPGTTSTVVHSSGEWIIDLLFHLLTRVYPSKHSSDNFGLWTWPLHPRKHCTRGVCCSMWNGAMISFVWVPPPSFAHSCAPNQILLQPSIWQPSFLNE